METKTTTIHARVEPKTKKEAVAILKKLGLSTSEAVALFLRQVSLNKGLPFPLRIPNEKTKGAIAEVRSGKNVRRYGSTEELFEDVAS